MEYGNQVELYEGVRTWFWTHSSIWLEQGVKIEHYIISSGLKEMIEGTEMAKEGALPKSMPVHLCSMIKVSLFSPHKPLTIRIRRNFVPYSKGILDINDTGVNDYIKPENQRVPFRNMIYIGDSDTDIPCMSLVER